LKVTLSFVKFLISVKYFILKLSGVASFAQERIFLDEKVRFSNEIAIYNELIILRVLTSSLSAIRLLNALRFVLKKQVVLRTSLYFNNEKGVVRQRVTDKHETFMLATEQTFKNESEFQNIIYETTINPSLFDLSSGRVFHCQILRQQKLLTEDNDNQFITDSDILIVAFHHAAFDRSSRQIFFNDLCIAYNDNIITEVDEELLQYIDYSVHEYQIDMTLSREFWHSEIKGYNFERSLSLPVDRHHLSNNQKSSLASVAQLCFDNDISTAFLDYASSYHVTPFQLGLATFYAFLFKLMHNQNDLCIACLNANRYRTELQNMIGMFIATLPYRMQLDPQWSFNELVNHVREKSLSILEHSHYPLQHILGDSRLTQSNALFLETVFDFITVPSDIAQLSLDGATLEQISLQQCEVAKFAFMLVFVYNPALDNNRLSCRFVCSQDMFNKTIIATINQRFQHFFYQLFSSNFHTAHIDQFILPINKLSLILPEEAEEISRTSFCYRTDIVNEGMSPCY
jgi:hypothetical protein